MTERRAVRPKKHEQWDEIYITPETLLYRDKGRLIHSVKCPDTISGLLRTIDPLWREARVTHRLRYKQSFASGDEWRTTETLSTRCFGIDDEFTEWKDHEYHYPLFKALGTEFGENGGTHEETWLGVGNLCDQQGCMKRASVTYRMKKATRKRDGVWCGETYDPYAGEDKRPLVRRFCGDHSRRGDCAIDDCDENYVLLEGVVSEPDDQLRSRSAGPYYVYAADK